MSFESRKKFIKNILDNMPTDWLRLTTHRLDVYNEQKAKVEFLEQLENLFLDSSADLKTQLKELPTAFDYIRLGHPLSCVLEWAIAKSNNLDEDSVISFSSQMMPALAILRKNLLTGVNTQIVYKDDLPEHFDAETLKNVYGYKFELVKINNDKDIQKFDGTTIALTHFHDAWNFDIAKAVDFLVSFHSDLGSVVLVNGEKNKSYISEILHVRRRESIAMTPHDCLSVLEELFGKAPKHYTESLNQKNKELVQKSIQEITNTTSNVVIGSSGLSIQYAIMMGLIHHSLDEHKGKKIKFIVPPNCYGGTNDQARRVAACLENVEILDLPVDREHNMVQSLEEVLTKVASDDAVPFIIAEIPTNPRVEVPDLDQLREVLSKVRSTKSGETATAPVFILDQTFCPNVNFLGDEDVLSNVKTISYVSGSKFPSGGLCTAGYCVANKKAQELMSYVDNHLSLCGNEATALQIEILANEMPSMLERISHAYKNTREFVDFIQATLPAAKINFVSEELASIGFTPSVFSLDLPTKGETHEEQEAYKRELNYKLINLMISEIPFESKHCVSYGQLKGCYWTIPATSTQGTTKEGDKDYIVRVAVSPELDLDHHKKVFARFCEQHISS